MKIKFVLIENRIRIFRGVLR